LSERDEILRRLEGRKVVASVSGGKDSAAMSLWLTEQGIDHERIFFDTGWEHPDLYDYLRGPLADAIGPITEIRGPLLMPDLIRKKGMFPSRVRRFCTQELKVLPAKRHFAAMQAAGVMVVNAQGIRAEESAARAKQPEWEWTDWWDCEVWRPLIRWTFNDVVAIHRRHSLAPCPLYLRGADRVGCWPCILSRKSEIRAVAQATPERIDLIRQLESEVKGKAAARYAAKGESFDSLGYVAPTFFVVHENVDESRSAPIDDVVSWALGNTDQLELFAARPEDGGCVRWGLCETASPGAPTHHNHEETER
jgi:3'-phosphoadenosine 5'-phosphosulfate sulfotransferase (PAPS reductase)/FAD synthetase